jgi:hypothetical protein
MDAKAWAKCPTIVANVALRMARQIELGWAQSSVLPDGEWRDGEPRFSLAKIRRMVPRGIDPEMDYFGLDSQNGWYKLSGAFCCPHTEWVFAARQDDERIRRYVCVWTDSAYRRIRGETKGPDSADPCESDLDEMCRFRWNQAWKLLGGRAPRFPTPGEATFVYGVDEWPDDLRELEGAAIAISAGSSPSDEEDFAMLVLAETIIRYDENGPMYVVAAYEDIEEAAK